MARPLWLRAVAVLLLPGLVLAGCATNPATGEVQLSFFGEPAEVEMGREADAEIVDEVGLYDDPDLQVYVEELGQRLAAGSERPQLPWSFKVLDDPAVNAFALPGGYVYVTRGILTHLGSEAELAMVLGHEIGHVTARHGVNQASKEILATLGLGIAVLVDPDLEDWAGVAAAGLGLLFLKYGRDDERQADDLGLRYAMHAGYDPRPMPEVFGLLDAVSKVEGVGRLPAWLSTHPNPGARRERLQQAMAGREVPAPAVVNRDDFLGHLDGVVFGENPRHGFFRGPVFLHPDLEFRFEFPPGWETANQQQAVSAAAPEEDAFLQISLAGQDSAVAAEEEFFSQQEGITRGRAWESKVHGLPARWSRLEASDDEGNDLRGTVAFVEHRGQVFQLLAAATAARWTNDGDEIEKALGSFARLNDPKALAVQPRTIQLVRLDKDTPLRSFVQKYPSTVPIETVALINHVAVDGTLPAGMLAKRVVGGEGT